MQKFMETFFRYTRGMLAFLIVIGCFGFLYLLAIKEAPVANKDTLNLAAGLVLGVLATVVAYYYGSSKDKSDQDQGNREQSTIVTQPQNPSPSDPK